MPRKPAPVLLDDDPRFSPWATPQRLQQRGALWLWTEDSPPLLPAGLQFPTQAPQVSQAAALTTHTGQFSVPWPRNPNKASSPCTGAPGCLPGVRPEACSHHLLRRRRACQGARPSAGTPASRLAATARTVARVPLPARARCGQLLGLNPRAVAQVAVHQRTRGRGVNARRCCPPETAAPPECRSARPGPCRAGHLLRQVLRREAVLVAGLVVGQAHGRRRQKLRQQQRLDHGKRQPGPAQLRRTAQGRQRRSSSSTPATVHKAKGVPQCGSSATPQPRPNTTIQAQRHHGPAQQKRAPALHACSAGASASLGEGALRRQPSAHHSSSHAGSARFSHQSSCNPAPRPRAAPPPGPHPKRRCARRQKASSPGSAASEKCGAHTARAHTAAHSAPWRWMGWRCRAGAATTALMAASANTNWYLVNSLQATTSPNSNPC